MRTKRVRGRVVGVDRRVVIEEVTGVDDEVVVRCQLRKGAGRRCGIASERSALCQGEGRRRWRIL
ncbi:MAG: hypothetical protein ACR2G7_06385, partial [Acidimicrobiales bacterium]